MPAIESQSAPQVQLVPAADKEPIVHVTEALSTGPTPTDWMAQMLPTIGARTLSGICLPRSHDTGMSMPVNSLRMGSQSTVQTQSNDIAIQLALGVRRFDVRACIRDGVFVCGHVQYISDSQVPAAAKEALELLDIDFLDQYSGGTGQTLESIVQQVNEFTSKHNELVILEISHSLNFDRAQEGNERGCSFNDAEYRQLFHQQLVNIKNRLVLQPSQQGVLTVPVKDLIPNSPAVILTFPDGCPIPQLPGDVAAGCIYQSQLDTLKELGGTTHTQSTNEAICAFVKDTFGEWAAKGLAWIIAGDSPWLQDDKFSIIEVAEAIKTTMLPTQLATVTKANFMNTVSLDNVDDTTLLNGVLKINML